MAGDGSGRTKLHASQIHTESERLLLRPTPLVCVHASVPRDIFKRRVARSAAAARSLPRWPRPLAQGRARLALQILLRATSPPWAWPPASFFFFICMARKTPAPTSKAQAARPPTVLRCTRRAAQAQYRLTWVACPRRCGRRARDARASLTYAADDGPDLHVRARGVIRTTRVLVRRGIVRRVGQPIVRALVHHAVADHVRVLRRGTCAATGVRRCAGFRATRPAERVGCSHAAAAATAVCCRASVVDSRRVICAELVRGGEAASLCAAVRGGAGVVVRRAILAAVRCGRHAVA